MEIHCSNFGKTTERGDSCRRRVAVIPVIPDTVDMYIYVNTVPFSY